MLFIGSIIDPSCSYDTILRAAEQCQVEITSIHLTSGQMFTMSESDALYRNFDIPIYIHKDDLTLVADHLVKQSTTNCQLKPNMKIVPLEDNAEITIGCRKGKLIHCPSYTKGSCCFQIGSFLFSGSVLDYYMKTLTQGVTEQDKDNIANIKEKLLTLPTSTVILPYQGPLSAIYDKLFEETRINNTKFDI